MSKMPVISANVLISNVTYPYMFPVKPYLLQNF